MIQKTVLLLLLILPVQLFAQSIDELILNKNYTKALEVISSKIQERPEAGLFFKQSIIFKELSKPLQASKALEQALFYDPASSLYLAELGENYSSLGNLYQAVECFKNAVLLAPEDLSLKGKLGRTYISIDDFKQAYEIFEAIHKVDSANVYFKKQFAFTAFKIGKPDLAVRLFEQVVQENPGDFGSHLNLIAIYKRMKDSYQVFQAGVRAWAIFPNNPTIMLRQADALFELKDYERAIFPYEKYLAGNDSTFEVLKNYGISLFFGKNEEKAICMLDKCMRLSPNDQYVYFYLGLAYKNLSELGRSAECLLAAIACSQPPYLSEMYHHLGQVYGSNREFEKSIEALQKAFELNNEKVEVLFEIATTYEEFNFNKTMALNYYSTYLKTAREKAKNADYALGRIKKIKEELFFDNQ